MSERNRFKTNNRVVLKVFDGLKNFISEENIKTMREEYKLIDLLFRLQKFHIQGTPIRWLAEHGRIINHGKNKKMDKMEFNFGGRKKCIFEPEHLALTTGLKFGPLPEVECDMSSQFLSLFPEDIEKLIFSDVLDILRSQSDSPIKKNTTIVRKLVVVYLFYKLILNKDPANKINDRVVLLADDPVKFNYFPWGRMVYEGIVSNWAKLFDKTSQKPVGEVWLKVVAFPFAVQCWFLEGLSPDQYSSLAEKVDDDSLPRVLRWNTRTSPDYDRACRSMFNHDEVTTLCYSTS